MARETVWQAIWRIDRKIPIALAVLLVMNLAVYFYLTNVVEKEADQLERKYISQQSEVRKAEQGGKLTESPLVVFARGSKELKEFREAIPTKNELTGLISEIFALAESSGLKIGRISYKPENLEEMALLSYELDFGVSGDYNQIKKFTFKIEQSDRIVSIDEMGLSSTPQGDDVSLKLKLTTYFRTSG